MCYEKTRPEVVGRGENPELSGLFGIKNLGPVKFWHNYLCPSLMAFFIGICVSLGVQDWELESLMSFMDLIYSLPLRGDDLLCWLRDPTHGFTVKGYYHCLSPTSLVTFTWSSIWKVKVSLHEEST